MTSFVRAAVFAGLSALAALVSPARAHAQARLSAGTGEVPARLNARVARTIAREWDVDTGSVVLSWGAGSLGSIPDTAAFRLMGGDGGWFSVQMEPAKGAIAWLRLRAGVTVDQAIATRALPAGVVLGAGDIRVEPRLRWGPPPLAPAPQAEPGWVIRRPVAGGDVLEGWRVAPPPVVSAGKPVLVRWNTGNVSVALEGVALNDAAVGQSVRVRTSGRIGVVAGTATAPGEARID